MGLLAGTKSAWRGIREIWEIWTCFIYAPPAKLSLSYWNRAPHASCIGGSRPLDYLRVVKKNLVSRKICAVMAIVGYRQAAETVQWSLAEGQGSCSPSVLEGGEMGELALTPAQMATNLHATRRS